MPELVGTMITGGNAGWSLVGRRTRDGGLRVNLLPQSKQKLWLVNETVGDTIKFRGTL